MTDAELRDELTTLLVAGHETTATMLCWTLDLILADARVHGRVRAEVEDGDGASHDYLDATVKEALRLRPVVPAVGRKLKAPMEIGGVPLPAGVFVVPSLYLTHRLPAYYPDPEAFKPERFLGKKPDPYAWLPFGGGARRCLGMAFALFELSQVLVAILARARLRKAHPAPAPVRLRGFTFVPGRGAEVVMDARAA